VIDVVCREIWARRSYPRRHSLRNSPHSIDIKAARSHRTSHARKGDPRHTRTSTAIFQRTVSLARLTLVKGTRAAGH